MDSGGRPRYVLEQIAERYPVVMHGVSLSIGSTDPARLRLPGQTQAPGGRRAGALGVRPPVLDRRGRAQRPRSAADPAQRADAARTSPTASASCRTSSNGRWCWRTRAPTSTFADSTISEWEFLSRLAEDDRLRPAAGRQQRLRLQRQPRLRPGGVHPPVPHRRVVQFHLAGHTHCGTHLIDTHDGPVIDPVWELYRLAHRLTGGAATLLEWDAKIPAVPGRPRRGAQGARAHERDRWRRPALPAGRVPRRVRSAFPTRCRSSSRKCRAVIRMQPASFECKPRSIGGGPIQMAGVMQTVRRWYRAEIRCLAYFQPVLLLAPAPLLRLRVLQGGPGEAAKHRQHRRVLRRPGASRCRL